MIIVVNKKLYKGKGILYSDAKEFLVDRTTLLGNPYKIGIDGDREEVINKYRIYLPNMLNKDKRVRQYYSEIKEFAKSGDVILICHCVPNNCHALIIKEMIEKDIKNDI